MASAHPLRARASPEVFSVQLLAANPAMRPGLARAGVAAPLLRLLGGGLDDRLGAREARRAARAATDDGRRGAMGANCRGRRRPSLDPSMAHFRLSLEQTSQTRARVRTTHTSAILGSSPREAAAAALQFMVVDAAGRAAVHEADGAPAGLGCYF